MDGNIAAVRLPEKNGKETHRWGVAEIQKMSPPTTGRCYQTKEWGQPTNGSAARRHGSQSQLYSFFCLIDRTLTHFFWSTGWEVISKFPSHSSLLRCHSQNHSLNLAWSIREDYEKKIELHCNRKLLCMKDSARSLTQYIFDVGWRGGGGQMSGRS